jgi:hypothetical protein
VFENKGVGRRNVKSCSDWMPGMTNVCVSCSNRLTTTASYSVTED